MVQAAIKKDFYIRSLALKQPMQLIFSLIYTSKLVIAATIS